MAVLVLTIAPGRGRMGDLVTINGDGFNLTPAQNVVTFDGAPAGVNTASATALGVVVPAGVAVDRHVAVVVTNLADATSQTWYWWSKDTIANTDAMLLRTKIPWSDEKLRGLDRAIGDMGVAEARFFERIATKVELLRDMLGAKGNFWSKAGAPLGVRQALAGTVGQPFVGAFDTTGGQFQDRQCSTLQWGLLLETLPDPSDLLDSLAIAGGNDNDVILSTGTQYEVAPFDGQIALASIRERTSVTSRVNRLQVLVNDVVVADYSTVAGTFPGLGIRNGDSETFYPGVRVSQGDRVSVHVYRNNTTTSCQALVYILVA